MFVRERVLLTINSCYLVMVFLKAVAISHPAHTLCNEMATTESLGWERTTLSLLSKRETNMILIVRMSGNGM